MKRKFIHKVIFKIYIGAMLSLFASGLIMVLIAMFNGGYKNASFGIMG